MTLTLISPRKLGRDDIEWGAGSFTYTDPITGLPTSMSRVNASTLPLADGTVSVDTAINGICYFVSGGTDTHISDFIAGLGGASACVALNRETWSIANDLTIPSNISLVVPKGALLSIASTKTLTISGPLNAGLYQIFSCLGSGEVLIGSGRWLYPQWWGMSTTATGTVNSAAIQAALDSGDVPVWITGGGTITHNGNIIIYDKDQLWGDGITILKLDALLNCSTIRTASASGQGQTTALTGVILAYLRLDGNGANQADPLVAPANASVIEMWNTENTILNDIEVVNAYCGSFNLGWDTVGNYGNYYLRGYNLKSVNSGLQYSHPLFTGNSTAGLSVTAGFDMKLIGVTIITGNRGGIVVETDGTTAGYDALVGLTIKDFFLYDVKDSAVFSSAIYLNNNRPFDETATDITFQDGTVQDCGTDATWIISLGGANSFRHVIFDNVTTRLTSPSGKTAGIANGAYGGVIRNSHVYGGGTGATSWALSTGTWGSILNCTVDSYYGRAISAYESVTVSGNTILNHRSSSGIYIQPACTKCIVTDNRINGATGLADRMSYGIEEGAGADYNIFADNKIVDYLTAPTLISGIYDEGVYLPYHATSTIVGWDLATMTSKTIYYKKVGGTVFVDFYLAGTSNAATSTFTLPYSVNTGPAEFDFAVPFCQDNTGTVVVSRGAMVTNIVTLYPTAGTAFNTWTASGTKRVAGQFSFEVVP